MNIGFSFFKENYTGEWQCSDLLEEISNQISVQWHTVPVVLQNLYFDHI